MESTGYYTWEENRPQLSQEYDLCPDDRIEFETSALTPKLGTQIMDRAS